MVALVVVVKGEGWSIDRDEKGKLHLSIRNPASFCVNKREVSVQLPEDFVIEVSRQKRQLREGAGE